MIFMRDVHAIDKSVSLLFHRDDDTNNERVQKCKKVPSPR